MRDDLQQLDHHFTTLSALNAAFMPFVRDSGIFIQTDVEFALGDFAVVTVTLPEINHTYTFTGEIIWITPRSIHNGEHPPGVGIQCSDDEGDAFQKAAQELLSGYRDDNGYSETM